MFSISSALHKLVQNEYLYYYYYYYKVVDNLVKSKLNSRITHTTRETEI